MQWRPNPTKQEVLMKKFIAAAALFMLAAAATAQTDWVRGTVVQSDAKRRTLTLEHAAFSNVRKGGNTQIQVPAGTGEFKVGKASLLKDVKPGDSVRFVAAMKGEAMVITQLQVAR
jgi:Cu/Ag efflux protein CusF